MGYNLITILGPTAVGKTSTAAKLAYTFNGEIISADSRQVYRRMDIGTGKDKNDYIINEKVIPSHLIDVIEPEQEFNLFIFNKLFIEAYKEIKSRNKIPFLVGGSPLYLNSIISNYDLKRVDAKNDDLETLSDDQLKDMLCNLNQLTHNTTDFIEKSRTIDAIRVAKSKISIKNNLEKINSLVIGIKTDNQKLKSRITDRLKARLKEGMIDEVKSLLNSGITFDKLKFFGLEYRFIALFLEGKINYNDMYQKLRSAIINFAKRQMTWYRKMEKDGIYIHWIEPNDIEKATEIIYGNYTEIK